MLRTCVEAKVNVRLKEGKSLINRLEKLECEESLEEI